MNRRNFLTGMAGILASAQAPAIVSASSIMRIKPILLPGEITTFRIPVAGGGREFTIEDVARWFNVPVDLVRDCQYIGDRLDQVRALEISYFHGQIKSWRDANFL